MTNKYCSGENVEWLNKPGTVYDIDHVYGFVLVRMSDGKELAFDANGAPAFEHGETVYERLQKVVMPQSSELKYSW